MSRKGMSKMDKRAFETIKVLLSARLNQRKIHDITGRGLGTVSLVKQSRDWEEYRAKIKEIVRKLNEKKVRKVESFGELKEKIERRAESPVNLTEEMKKREPSKDTILLVNALEKINITLERLVTAWEAKSEKRGIFG